MVCSLVSQNNLLVLCSFLPFFLPSFHFFPSFLPSFLYSFCRFLFLPLFLHSISSLPSLFFLLDPLQPAEQSIEGERSADCDTDNEKKLGRPPTQQESKDLDVIQKEGIASFCTRNLQAVEDIAKDSIHLGTNYVSCFFEYYRRVLCPIERGNNRFVKSNVFFFYPEFIWWFMRSEKEKYQECVPSSAVVLFSYDFWVFPVYIEQGKWAKQSHWSLVVVCYPNDKKRLAFHVLDSLVEFSMRESHFMALILNVRSYHQMEYGRLQSENGAQLKKIPPWILSTKCNFFPGVPQQEKNCDCGIFLLYFLRVFLFTPLFENGCDNWPTVLTPVISEQRAHLSAVIKHLRSTAAANTVQDRLKASLESLLKDSFFQAEALNFRRALHNGALIPPIIVNVSSQVGDFDCSLNLFVLRFFCFFVFFFFF